MTAARRIRELSMFLQHRGMFAGREAPSQGGRPSASTRVYTPPVRLRQAPCAMGTEVETIGDILDGDTSPNRLPASTAVLDRIGLGANVKHDVEVKGSEALAAIILRLDAQERRNSLNQCAPAGQRVTHPPVPIRRTQLATDTSTSGTNRPDPAKAGCFKPVPWLALRRPSCGLTTRLGPLGLGWDRTA